MGRALKALAVLTGFAVLLVFNESIDRAAAQKAEPGEKQNKKGDKATRKALAILDERMEMKDFQGEITLKDAIQLLNEHLEARGIEFNIIVNAEAFKQENPDAPDLFETRIRFPALPKKMAVANVLNIALKPVPTNNATFIILADRIEITTYSEASVERRLQQRIMASFENRKLSEVLREISEKFGTTIVIDKRAGDKEDRLVSATFLNDVNLAGALRVLSEMAELKVVVLDGAIYVTTPAQAETLRKEKMRMDEQLSPLWPILPPNSGGGGALAAGFGFMPALPGQLGFPAFPFPARR